MNKPVKIAIAVVVVLLGLNFTKNLIIQATIEGVISKAAHVPVKVGSTSAAFLTGKMSIKNFRIFNPRHFPEPLLLNAPLIAVHFDAPAFLKGQAHFHEVRLNLKEIVVIKNSQGQLNVDALKGPKGQDSSAVSKRKDPAKKGSETKLKIDKLYLTIGRVVYKDYSQGGQPSVQIFDINMQDREFTNIDNPGALVSLVMFEALTRTTLSRLANLDVSIFKDGASSALSKGLGLVSDGAGSFDEAAKGIANLFK